MRAVFWELEKLGRTRLSENFYFRQFLHSEIGSAFGISNIPDYPDLAIETGTRLCQDVLEPLQRQVGQLVIRSGFRSARLNAFGAANRLKCGSNAGNFAYHIWDHLDDKGHRGAAACIVAPRFNDRHCGSDAKAALARIIDDHLNYHSVTFFAHDNAFNIGWHEKPLRRFYPRRFTPFRAIDD